MEYKIIFSTGDNPQYITLERVNKEFSKDKICYLEDNLVILHRMGREMILQTIPELHRWMFFKRWIPLTTDQLIKYFYPKDQWEIVSMDVE